MHMVNLLSASRTVITLNPGNKDAQRLFNGGDVVVFFASLQAFEAPLLLCTLACTPTQPLCAALQP